MKKIFVFLVLFGELLFCLGVVGVNASEVESAYSPSSNSGNILPACVVSKPFSKECLNVSVFAALAINIGRYLFTVVGALALLAFVYGGFTLIISSGNQEKVKQGWDAIKGAVIGLVVAFAGYVIVRYVGDNLGVSDEFLKFIK